MHKVIEWFKAHPALGGFAIFAAGLLLILLLFSGRSSQPAQVVAPADNSNTANGTALQVAQLQAQTALGAAGIQASTDQAAIAAAQNVQNNQTNAGVTVALAQNQTAQQYYTLQAQTEQQAIAAEQAINDSQMSAAQQIATIQGQTTTAVAGLQAQVANNNIAANQTLGLASIAQQGTQASLNYEEEMQALQDSYTETLNRQSLIYQNNAQSIGVASAVTQATGLMYIPTIQQVA